MCALVTVHAGSYTAVVKLNVSEIETLYALVTVHAGSYTAVVMLTDSLSFTPTASAIESVYDTDSDIETDL